MTRSSRSRASIARPSPAMTTWCSRSNARSGQAARAYPRPAPKRGLHSVAIHPCSPRIPSIVNAPRKLTRSRSNRARRRAAARMSDRSSTGGSQTVPAPAKRNRGGLALRNVISSTGRKIAASSSVTNPWMLQGNPSTKLATRTRTQRGLQLRDRLGRVFCVPNPAHVRAAAIESLGGVTRPHRAGSVVEPFVRDAQCGGRRVDHLERRRRNLRRPEELVDGRLVFERDPLGPATAVGRSSRDAVHRRERRREYERIAIGIEAIQRFSEQPGRVTEQLLFVANRRGQVGGRWQVPLDDVGVGRTRPRPGSCAHAEHEASARPEPA